MSAYSFTDSNGTNYEFKINFRTIFYVAEKTGIDLLNPDQVEDGSDLESRLVTKPGVVVKVVAALCGIDDLDAFYDAIDGTAYKELEKAFWDAYLNFFVQSGRNYIAAALKVDLEATQKMAREMEKRAEEGRLQLEKQTFLSSSPSPESKIGKVEPSGKSTDSPKPISKSTVQEDLKSSALSTTRMRRNEKTSVARPTSTRSKKPALKKKR